MAVCIQCEGAFESKRRGRVPLCCPSCAPFEGRRAKGASISEEDVPDLILCHKCRQPRVKADYYRYANNAPHQWCKSCVRRKAVESQHRFKLECIEYKGGVCVDCKRMPHPAAMTFHHLDPSVKEFQLSNSRTKVLSETVRQELSKCVLLCRNCHDIRHADMWDWDVKDSK